MEYDHSVAATTRYLRFPLAEDHRSPVQDGSRCPHCSAKHVQKWGRFSGRQRYRCRGCGRTFSTFTGTALRYLKHPERWRRFLWCVDGRLTVRESASVIGVNKDTALRWRHRLLDQWRSTPGPLLHGRVEIGGFCVPRSYKGTHPPDRDPRKRGAPWCPFPHMQEEPVPVLVAWSSASALMIKSARSVEIRTGDLEETVGPRLGSVTALIGAAGPWGAVARFAVLQGVAYRRESRAGWPPQVFRVRRRLRLWMRPFRGVATRRLDNYLEWFRRRGGPP